MRRAVVVLLVLAGLMAAPAAAVMRPSTVLNTSIPK